MTSAGNSSSTGPDASGLTHIDPATGEARMVDVGGKDATERRAVAEGVIWMSPDTFRLLAEGRAAKGDPLATARIAGILAAKRTAELIPLCHPIALTRVSVDFDLDPKAWLVRVRAEAHARDRTGVEMEALVAVSLALLTLYDMLKAVDRGMRMGDICLLEKEGGRSGHWRRGSAVAPGSANKSPETEG